MYKFLVVISDFIALVSGLLLLVGCQSPLWSVELGGPALGFGNEIAFSPDGKLLFLGCSRNGTFRCVDPEDGRTIWSVTAHEDDRSAWLLAVTAIAVSEDGRKVVTGTAGARSGKVRVWEASSGTFDGRLDPIGLLSGVVADVAIDEHGDRIAACDENGAIALWRDGGRLLAVTWRAPAAVVQMVFDCTGRLNCVDLQGGVIIINPDGRVERHQLTGELGVAGATINSRGDRAAFGTYDGQLRVYEVESQEVLWGCDFEQGNWPYIGPIRRVAFAGPSQLIVVLRGEERIPVYEDGELLRTHRVGRTGVNAVALSHSRRALCAIFSDTFGRYWLID